MAHVFSKKLAYYASIMHSLPTYYAQEYAGILPSCLVVDNPMLEMELTNLEYLFFLKLLYPKSSATYSKTADKLLSLLHNYIMLMNRTIMKVELSAAFLVVRDQICAGRVPDYFPE